MKKALLNKVIEVRTDVHEVQVLLETFFQAFPPGQGKPSLAYTIRAFDGKFWVLEGNGEAKAPLFCGGSPLEIVYLFETFLYYHFLPSVNERLILHAGVVAKGGKALLLLGPSGSGKSMLTTALLERSEDFSYFSDDVSPLSMSPEEGKYRVSPFPRAIRLRDGIPLPFSLPSNQCLLLPSYSIRFFLPVQRFATSEVPVSLMLFPEWDSSRLEFLQLKKGEAALYLTCLAFNKTEYIMGGGLGLIAQLAQGVPAYRFLWNEPFRAAEAIEKLFSEQR